MLPADEEIQNLSRTGDVFKYAIVGFSAIELALEELISESLLTSHSLELTRLSVELKVDLAIGLGLLSRDSKGLLIKLSKIRNYYAHEFNPAAEYCTSSELKSCLTKVHRKFTGDYFDKSNSFRETLRISFIAAYYELVQLISRQQEIRKRRKEVALHTKAVLELSPKVSPEVYSSPEYKLLMEELENKKKEILLRDGELKEEGSASK